MRIILLSVLFFFSINSYAQNKIPEQWITFFEKSGYTGTPDYNETINYFSQLENNSEYVRMISFGITPQGREMFCCLISKDKAFTPALAVVTGKPLVMIINGIHAGEIEGKDASMLMLREMLVTKEKEFLLDSINLIIIPVFNADGHERRSSFNRINQNGPEEMGWRTTAQNLNLNRDWMKADAPEMQSMLKLFSEWLPDFTIDSHTTDGADYQYVITYGTEKFENIFSGTRNWVRNKFIPFFEENLNSKGFLNAPYTGFKDNDLYKGITDWVSSPRLSTGYFACQNRPSLLIETHMLKSYKERVFSTKAAFETVLEFINKNPGELKKINKLADEMTVEDLLINKKFLPLTFRDSDSNIPFRYKGIESIKDSSRISGTEKITYTGKPFEIEIPFYNESLVKDSIKVPRAYIIPAEWKFLVDRMKLHGIKAEQINEEEKFDVTRYKFKDVKFAASSYEGRQTVSYAFDKFKETVTVPAGSYLIKTDQRTIKLIVYLLAPESEDSFLRWGFLNSIFERKEYFEDYVMEKISGEMIKDNPALLREFEKKLNDDEAFRNNPRSRLNFFYERSPYFDKKWNLYPVMLIE